MRRWRIGTSSRCSICLGCSFCRFSRRKGGSTATGGSSSNGFTSCMERGGSYHKRVLRPLFFGTLNTPVSSRAPAARAFGAIPFLNGGLFAPAPLERRWPAVQLTDASLGRAFGELFTRYRFTAREDSDAWSEAAIDPEMLGKSFESLMSSRERRSSGAFYTPQSLVGEVTRSALASALMHAPLSREIVERALAGDAIPAEYAPILRARIARHARARPRVRLRARSSCTRWRHSPSCKHARATHGSLAVLRRELLTRSIFGVDVNPTAVWLCELRLWLSVVIESEESSGMRVTPLPNLDRHIRVGDSLSGDAFEELRGAGGSAIARHASPLRARDRCAQANARARPAARASAPSRLRTWANRSCAARLGDGICSPQCAVAISSASACDPPPPRWRASRASARGRASWRCGDACCAPAAPFPSRGRRTSPTSRCAADSTSSLAIRRGFGSTASLRRRARHSARAITCSAARPGSAARGPRTPASVSRRRSISARSFSSARSRSRETTARSRCCFRRKCGARWRAAARAGYCGRARA